MKGLRTFLHIALLLVSLAILAEPARAPLTLTAPVQDKNFYVLSLVERNERASAVVAGELSEILKAKRDALRTCPSVECLTTAMRFSDEEIAKGADVFRRLQMIEADLRVSGTYAGDVSSAWMNAANGINNIIDVYGAGKPPLYPDIDSVSFDVKSNSFAQMLQTVAANLGEQDMKLFFQPSLRFALYLLRINNRDEAGRHEPLESKENAEAVKAIRSIRWKDFPYTVIVVPGSGPDRLTWSLSPVSRLRIEIAARRFHDHKAPLILVSGGYVHPKQTPYCEAIEMKKALIDELGVPAKAILIDPHARHTTTNLRNAARIMYRDGIPFDRKALITTDGSQSAYIQSADFAKRCDEQLGFRPVNLFERISIFDQEFTARVDSLRIDPRDPLDP